MDNRLLRILKHRWMDGSASRRAIPPALQKKLAQRVATSEHLHSGEIRIYVEGSLPLSYLLRNAPLRKIIRQRAVTMFGKLRIWDTGQNNGVLIYLLLAERAIEIVADRGLNSVPQHPTLTPPSNTPLGKPHGVTLSAQVPKMVCI